ncbi:low affinity immunoglobulin gamma Fc region receptor II-like isoform X2 [Larimichthys crocea]|uniref:low affinity immunoglobulin gamma Fc region receptor II-like isoform X2 n=1 Tax=Larimichthys crocea TaxID=215358 RepID=UPI000F5FD3CE|nr:low affinity immunoglobulin gamma Fc region receptor II-like isoform X2 [Larimichthys crocea]
MEVRALCIRMLLTVLVLLLSAQVQHSDCHKADAYFPRIVPSRLQFFEYESVFINCDELSFFNETEWRVMRKFDGRKTICNVKWEKTGSCNITSTFAGDSGEYWCQAEGKTSSIVNIVVTAGSVILESPALPVMEGDDVTLRCRNRNKTTSNLKADFYKDGVLIRSSSTGNVTIRNVSQSDEGHYKCHISGTNESAESWLAVRDDRENLFTQVYTLISIVIAVFLLLLFLMGLCHWYKGASTSLAYTQTSSPPQTVSAETGANDIIYAAVTIPRKNDTSEAQLQQATDVDVTTQEPKNRRDEDESVESCVYHTLRFVPSESANPC